MKKRIFLILIAFSCAFLSIFNFTVMHNKKVFASTDYNIFNIIITEIITRNANYTLTDTGFIIETKITDGASFINCYYKLLPDTQFVLRWTAEKLIDGSSNAVFAWGSRDQHLGGAIDGNELTFTTDETGTGCFLFYAKTGVSDTIYKTEYSNIYLGFVDETLGAVYMEAYNSGYYDGAKPYEENWEVYHFTDDSLSDRCWKIYEYTSQYTGLKANYHRSSAVFTLSLGYYRVEQKFLDFEASESRPIFYTPLFTLGKDFLPIAYLDKNSSPPIHLPIDIVGALNSDRYIYFSVPYDNCQVRFQFVTTWYVEWDDSYNSLNQLIELSFDANFGNRYYEVYERGYNNGKTDGYSEGKSDGLLTGYNNGYVDGYSTGKDEGLSTGYNDGYNEGYNIGFNEGSSSSITTSWFTSFVNSIFDIFNIEIFPNVKLIYLFFIPVGFGIILLILKLIRG